MVLSKAFDTLNYDLLIAKLHPYGFSEESLKLTKGSQTNRWQRTVVNISFSSWSELLLCLPLGSVLGVLPFDIYIYIYIYIYIFMTYFISLNATMPAT